MILDSHTKYMWVRKSINPKWQNQVLFEAAAVLFKVLLKKWKVLSRHKGTAYMNPTETQYNNTYEVIIIF